MSERLHSLPLVEDVDGGLNLKVGPHRLAVSDCWPGFVFVSRYQAGHTKAQRKGDQCGYDRVRNAVVHHACTVIDKFDGGTTSASPQGEKGAWAASPTSR